MQYDWPPMGTIVLLFILVGVIALGVYLNLRFPYSPPDPPQPGEWDPYWEDRP